MGKEEERHILPLSPGACVIDLMCFKYWSGSFIYTQLYLFRLTLTLKRSEPITYALLMRMLSSSPSSFHLLFPSFPSLSFFNSSLLLLLMIIPYSSHAPPSFLFPILCSMETFYWKMKVNSSLILLLVLMIIHIFHMLWTAANPQHKVIYMKRHTTASSV